MCFHNEQESRRETFRSTRNLTAGALVDRGLRFIANRRSDTAVATVAAMKTPAWKYPGEHWVEQVKPGSYFKPRTQVPV
jgi:hypothetical protein